MGLSLSGVDLNLLVALDALLIERSITRAAERVGRTQPAMSHALQRLRLMFSDELLVRGERGLELTHRAAEIHPLVVDALATIETALGAPRSFEPGRSKQVFKVGSGDVVRMIAAGPLLRRLTAEAPLSQLELSNCGLFDGPKRLLAGELDLLIGSYLSLPAGLLSRDVFEVSLPCVVDRNNPVLRDGRIDLAGYLELPHVVVGMNGSPATLIDNALSAMNLRRHIALVVPDYLQVPAAVRGTSLIGHSSRATLDLLSYADELLLTPSPVVIPPSRVRVVWQRKRAGDPGLKWFREVVIQVLLGLEQLNAPRL